MYTPSIKGTTLAHNKYVKCVILNTWNTLSHQHLLRVNHFPDNAKDLRPEIHTPFAYITPTLIHCPNKHFALRMHWRKTNRSFRVHEVRKLLVLSPCQVSVTFITGLKLQRYIVNPLIPPPSTLFFDFVLFRCYLLEFTKIAHGLSSNVL